MIDVTFRLLEFMDSTPVSGAEVNIIVEVLPRWQVFMPRYPDQPIGSNNPRVRTFEPGWDVAERFTEQRESSADGTARATFEVSSAFERMRQQRDIHGDPPFDVVAVLSAHVACTGLERTMSLVHFGALTDAETSADLLGENANIETTVALDFAKVIVGHTTRDSATLWFNLHGMAREGNRYVCEIDQISSGIEKWAKAVQSHPVVFDPASANIAILPVANLQPATPYAFTLRFRTDAEPDVPRAGRIIARGEFVTAPADAERLSLVFGSCHLPRGEETLERWQQLAKRRDYDLMLLIGDQIYGDEIEHIWPSATWFERYVNRYHQLWQSWPMREVLRRTPTYMALDDHEVIDDWGSVEVDQERLEGALGAYRLFQQAHNPGGVNGPIHYSFRWGPAAFFVMDSRTSRGSDPNFPILGPAQYQEFLEWAGSDETRATDVIFFVAPVPLAFLPVQEVFRLTDELKQKATEAGLLGGGVIGGIVGGVVGLFLGGPVGAVGGAIVGSGIGTSAGGIGAHFIAEDKIQDAGLADLYTLDLADHWTYEPNQHDLVRVLDCLFDLANDVQADGRPGPHPRAVFILAGDVHSGSMHLIGSKRMQHNKNPFILQLTSSAISMIPATDKLYEGVVRHIQPSRDISASYLLGHVIANHGFNDEKLLADVLGSGPAKFFLDDKRGSNYVAEFVDLLAARNFGHITVEHVDGRIYRFYFSIEGKEHSLVQDMELDLDAPVVTPRNLIGEVLATEGRVTFLRVNDVGTRYGAPPDQIDVEVVVQLDSEPGRAFGFHLRDDANEATHRQMLDLLREAFKSNRRVSFEYARTGYRNGLIVRVVEAL